MAKHLRKFIEELEAKGTSEIVARAQATIALWKQAMRQAFCTAGQSAKTL
jgi:hypothetical protein